ncbi:hypothetical protein DFH11DRAFT_1549147 [Phellopilus nigrolimitatus]|nr:hypothetical protein DFH11DRAFT_1549147 [Phellopilus nigrolimitatus]
MSTLTMQDIFADLNYASWLFYIRPSIGCYYPSYLEAGIEILRALPPHLLVSYETGRQGKYDSHRNGSSFASKTSSSAHPYGPKVPSPLRTSTVLIAKNHGRSKTTDKPKNINDSVVLKNHELEDSASIALIVDENDKRMDKQGSSELNVPKRGQCQPRRPNSNSKHHAGSRYKTQSRKSAYAPTVHKENPGESREATYAFSTPKRAHVLSVTKAIATPMPHVSVSPGKSAAAELRTLLESAAEARAKAHSLRVRVEELEEQERRSVEGQARLEEGQRRLEDVCEALIEEGKERRLEISAKVRKV